MRILLLEPYFTGSHAAWARGLAHHSSHEVKILSLPGRHWKWRMQGGALTLAERFRELNWRPDLVLATDMLALGSFLALTRDLLAGIPAAIYFHENQFVYPASPTLSDQARERDVQYAFMNYSSALSADALFFNSDFNRSSFFQGIANLLQRLPDFQDRHNIETLRDRGTVLPVGLDLEDLEKHRPREARRNSTPRILWNHRWEHDKNPAEFMRVMEVLHARGREFELVLLGKGDAREPLRNTTLPPERIAYAGYVSGRDEYVALLWSTDIIPITSHHEFFGVSVLEAVYCANRPLLPRRLSYPEILPEDSFPGCYYGTSDELPDLLEDALKNISDSRREYATSPLVGRFDWRKIIQRYDSELANVRFRHGPN